MPTSLAIREVKMKTIVRYHFTFTMMAIIKTEYNNKCYKDVEKLKPSYTACGNVK